MKSSLKLLALLALAAPAIAMADPALIGSWKTAASFDKAMAGAIEIRQDGSAQLAPEGYPPMEGAWSTKDGKLVLVMPPHGASTMDFKVDASRLTLTYNNGAEQTFERASSEKEKTQ